MITKKNIKDLYECSPLQKGILYHAVENPVHPRYFQQVSLSIQGVMEPTITQKSLQLVIDQYDILRTVFSYKDFSQPMQIVLKEREVVFSYVDLTHLDQFEQAQTVQNQKKRDRQKGFDVTRDSLIRFTLFRLGHGQYELMWSFHHILMDGWCLGLLLDDWLAYYAQLVNEQPVTALPAIPYSHYLKWLAKQDQTEAMHYWRDYLTGYEVQTGLEMNEDHTASETIHHTRFESLDEDVTAQMVAWCREHQVTLNQFVQGAWAIVLQKLNHTRDVVFGSVVSGRHSEVAHVEKMVGLFINTIPVRVQSQPTDTFADLVQYIGQASVRSQQYDYLSLADIQSHTPLKNQLIDHILAFESYPMDREQINQKSRKLGFEIMDFTAFEQTNYDLNVLIYPGDRLGVKFIYHPQAMEEQQITQIFNYLQQVIHHVLQHSDQPIRTISLLTDEEKKNLIQSAAGKRDFPRTETVVSLFEAQVQETPQQLAVQFQAEQYSYDRLNRRANQLARHLKASGVNAGKRVAMVVERSLDLVVGVLAILKAGGAYVPIEPDYPADRINYILQDSGACMVLTQEAHKGNIPISYTGKVICVDQQAYYQGSADNLPHIAQPSDLIYLIYTSGSTGKPKGVMVEHQHVVQLLFQDEMPIEIQPREVWAMFHSYCFDVSVFEMFGALLNGVKLVLLPEAVVKSSKQLRELLIAEKVDSVCQTPTSFVPLAAEEIEHDDNRDLQLKRILFAGESLLPGQLAAFHEKYPDIKLLNMYGPTEATVYAAFKEITGQDIAKNISNIGKPLPMLHMHVLDLDGQLVPVGVKGELYISGAGVTRGYLNREALTAERFLPDPFVPSERMYRTGDFVRRLPNGEIEYLGRMDDQVKIRGYRIELGEIQTCLLTHSGVREAVVIAKQETSATTLCAYIVGEAEISELRELLAQKLPAYMIPSYWVQLDALPTTTNGKLDRRALPEPTASCIARQYAAPETKTEEKLVQLWQSVLDVKQIGVTDDFFSVGGHSLKAMSLLAKIHKTFQIDLSLRDIFDRPTIRQLGQHIQQAKQSAHQSIEAAPKQAHYPVTFAQKRLFVLQGLENIGTGYNMPFAFEIQGDLKFDRLQHALQKLVERHEVLRTSFHLVDGELVQKIATDVSVKLSRLQTKPAELAQQIREFVQPFALDQAPLMRVACMQLAPTNTVVVFDMHHIISDGVSLKIFFHELAELYQGRSLYEQTLQYKDFAVWQHDQVAQEQLREQREYWKNQFAGELPVLGLPTDFARPPVQQFTGDVCYFSLPLQLSRKLNQFAVDNRVTLHMILLATYQALLLKYTDQEDVIVGTPVAGRPHTDVENVIGMFVNTLAIRSQPKRQQTFAQFLAHVKQQVLSAYEHSDYPLEQLLDQLDLQRDLSRNPLFDTMFVFQNTAVQPDLQLPSMKVSPCTIDWKSAKVDLTLTAIESNGDEPLAFAIEYNTALFHKATVERMFMHFGQLLETVLDQPAQRLGSLAIVSSAEEKQLLHKLHTEPATYPRTETAVSLFEAQVQQTPTQIAIRYQSEQLNYAELNSRVNQLARHMQANGVTSGERVAMVVGRSIDLIVGVLAIIKAGGAYVPIEPDYPADRIDYILQDSGACLVLTQEAHKGNIPTSYTGKVICIDQASCYQGNADNLSLAAKPEDLIYLIYTSGSTGKPKGVMVEHRHVVQLLFQDDMPIKIEPSEVWAMYHSYCFDISVFEMFGTLLNGAKLVLLSETVVKSPKRLREVLIAEQVDSVCQTPTSFVPFSAEEVEHATRSLQLKRILFGGESLLPGQLAAFHEKYPNTKLWNMYGPTEATVYATYKQVTQRDIAENISNIGKPMPMLRLYILDADGQLVPVGVKGELYIAGEGVTRGYLNRESLTTERFLPDPFVPGERMYRTGDYVSWRADGDIEYLGRMDDQVKIRGYRIELGEIQTCLRSHPRVQEAVVLARQEATPAALCAYFVGEATVSELRGLLAQQLPAYMIPSYWVQLDVLPMTTNGKLDRRALPEPTEAISQTEFVPASTETEELLAQIWQEVLHIETVGVNDNFFELGGDSIKAMQIAAKLHQQGKQLEMKHLFQSPTIAEIAATLQMAESESTQEEHEVVYTPFQQQLLDNPNGKAYTTAVLSYAGQVSLATVEQVVAKLVNHHDAFQQYNRNVDQLPAQVDEVEIPSDVDVQTRIDASLLEMQQRLEASRSLLNVRIFRTPAADFIGFVAHRLVMDTQSWGILLADFAVGYQQSINQLEIQFAPKTMPFHQWVRQSAQLGNMDYSLPDAEVSSDSDSIANAVPVIVPIKLSQTQTEQLAGPAHQAYQTQPRDLLFAALLCTLADTERSDIAIDCVDHNRTAVQNSDVSQTVGCFTTTMPTWFTQLDTDNLSILIRLAKETLHTEQASAHVPAQSKTMILFDIGEQPQATILDDGPFAVVRIHWEPISPLTRGHQYDLAFTGTVTDGKLQLTVQSDQWTDESDANSWCERFQQSLERVIAHCLSQSETQLTPSDFEAQDDISVDDLDQVVSFLKQNLNG